MTSYDLRFGANRLHDRYLFYLVPLLLISCTAMVRERDWPRWAVFGAGALLAMAFAFMPVVRYDKFNVDSPVALLNEPLLGIAGSVNGARALLAFVTIAVTLLLMVGRRVALAVVVVGALAIPALAGGAFTRLLAHDGTSGRPITVDQSVVFDWIDRKVGTGSSVTMLPYPFLYGSYWENVAYWWNVEFWNASVRNAAVYEDAFTGTPETFPTVPLDVDRQTGRANVSPSDYVVQGVAETRFHLVREGARRGSRRRADPHAAPMACRLARLRPVSRRLDDSEGNGHDQSLRHPRAGRDRAALPDDLRAGAAGRPADAHSAFTPTRTIGAARRTPRERASRSRSASRRTATATSMWTLRATRRSTATRAASSPSSVTPARAEYCSPASRSPTRSAAVEPRECRWRARRPRSHDPLRARLTATVNARLRLAANRTLRTHLCERCSARIAGTFSDELVDLLQDVFKSARSSASRASTAFAQSATSSRGS